MYILIIYFINNINIYIITKYKLHMDINIIKIDDLLIDNIALSKSVSIGENQRKISIGYLDFVDLHIQTPTIKCNMNYVQNINYQSFKIRFEPMLGPILKLYNLIISIEILIKQHILKHNSDYKLCSIIKSEKIDQFDDSIDDYIRYILLELSSNKNLTIFNDDNQIVDIYQMKNGYKYRTLLKIDSIWINTATKKFGLKLELVQLKIIIPISTIRCLIDINPQDIQLINDKIVKKDNLNVNSIMNPNPIINTNPNPNPNPIINTNSNINNNILINQQSIVVDRVIFRPPDPSQLLQLKNSLKKIIE